jgi:hypothetical protein
MNAKLKLTVAEREGLLRILRANVKAAKAAILGREAELKAAFEIQLDTLYPPAGDPVWNAEYKAAVEACRPHVERIEKRCDELGIGTRFRPSLSLPCWDYGGDQLFKKLRVERRRIAHLQITEKLKNDVVEMERKSAATQMEIIANGFVTDAAREFLEKLPAVEELIPPMRVEELVALVEGKALPAKTLTGRLNALTGSQAQAQLKDGDECAE